MGVCRNFAEGTRS